MNASTSLFGEYLIDFCSDDQHIRLSISIEMARLGAGQAHHDASGPNIFGFEPFFKSTDYPVATVLADMAEWRPLGFLTPRFACVNRESSEHFSDIRPSVMELCRHPPTTESVFLRGHNYIFVCPATWGLVEETKSPDHGNCPDVEGNVYVEGIVRVRIFLE